MSKRIAEGLKVCPKCGYDAVFVPLIPAVGYDGRLYGSRSEGFCNNPQCDQRFWYHPRSGRVTRRHVGMTLKEYTTKRNWQGVTVLDLINIRRRNASLAPLMEVPDKLRSTIPVELPSLSLLARLRRGAVGWFWWIVAALKSPFLGKLPPSKVLPADKTINEVRMELGFDPVEVDNAE